MPSSACKKKRALPHQGARGPRGVPRRPSRRAPRLPRSALTARVPSWPERVVTLPNVIVFFFNDPATTEIYTLSLHDALPICGRHLGRGLLPRWAVGDAPAGAGAGRSEEHTSELQSQSNLVCRPLLAKRKTGRRRPAPVSTGWRSAAAGAGRWGA